MTDETHEVTWEELFNEEPMAATADRIAPNYKGGQVSITLKGEWHDNAEEARNKIIGLYATLQEKAKTAGEGYQVKLKVTSSSEKDKRALDDLHRQVGDLVEFNYKPLERD